MKLAIVISYLLILAFHLFPGQSISDGSPDPVLDLAGKNLEAGVKYYILPLIRGRGGGVTVSTFSKNQTYCHRGVVQENLEVLSGTPVTFTPVNPKKGVIRISTDLNIKFATSIEKSCPQSYVWKLEFDQKSGNRFIETGGVEGNPGIKTLSNWFKIEKSGDFYKLNFCPNVCSFCKVICKDVGVTLPEKGRRLVLTDDSPFLVMFRKATSEEEEEKSQSRGFPLPFTNLGDDK